MKQDEFKIKWLGHVKRPNYPQKTIDLMNKDFNDMVNHLLPKQNPSGVREELKGKLLREYIKTKANQDECVGFSNGMDAICNTLSPQSDAVEFAEWLSKKGYIITQDNYSKNGIMWFNHPKGIGLTTKELYDSTEFNLYKQGGK